jgi:hypothetical protein
VVVHTSEGWNDGLHIRAGDMVWERVWLSSGEPARLCAPLRDADTDAVVLAD